MQLSKSKFNFFIEYSHFIWQTVLSLIPRQTLKIWTDIILIKKQFSTNISLIVATKMYMIYLIKSEFARQIFFNFESDFIFLKKNILWIQNLEIRYLILAFVYARKQLFGIALIIHLRLVQTKKFVIIALETTRKLFGLNPVIGIGTHWNHASSKFTSCVCVAHK